jgi:formyl-CoA transferase
MRDLTYDEALEARGTVVRVMHPKRGEFRTVGNPIRLSDSPTEVRCSPALGEHTEEIMKGLLGFDDAAVARAREEGAI